MILKEHLIPPFPERAHYVLTLRQSISDNIHNDVLETLQNIDASNQKKSPHLNEDRESSYDDTQITDGKEYTVSHRQAASSEEEISDESFEEIQHSAISSPDRNDSHGGWMPKTKNIMLRDSIEQLEMKNHQFEGTNLLQIEPLQEASASFIYNNEVKRECDVQIERYQDENKSLKDNIEKLKGEQKILQEQYKALEATNKALNIKYEAQSSQLQEEHKLLTDARYKLERQNNQPTQITEELLDQVLKENDEANVKLKELESTLFKERSKYQSDIDQLLSKNKRLIEHTKKQKQNDQDQIKKLEKSIEAYRKELDPKKCLSAHSEHQKIVNELLLQQENYKSDLKAVRKQLENVAKEHDAKIKELAASEDENENIKRKTDAKIKDLSDRLSAEMSKKVSTDESNLENVGVKNRPMNIATEYELLCSNHWLVAKTHLDDANPSTPEETKLNFLSKILVDSECMARQYQNQVMNNVHQILTNPFAIEKNKGSSSTETTTEMHVFVTDFLRIKADSADLKYLVKEMKQTIDSENTEFRDISQEALHEYIQGCTKLAWKMALQRPPMTFSLCNIGQPWAGPDYDELFWSSSDPANPKSKVKCCVIPRLYHGEALMVKGRAYLAKN